MKLSSSEITGMKSYFKQQRGRLMVNAYYIVSPPIANIISKSERLKATYKKIFIKAYY